jgi:hypothetical protein
VLAVPAGVLADKKRYVAQLNAGNEVPPRASSAFGPAQFIARPGVIEFRIKVSGLSAAPTGAHIHAPATTAQNAGIVARLCGAPAPAVLPVCTFDASTGVMFVEGVITPELLQAWGITGAQLAAWMDGGLAYVNVHTPTYPGGEVRGQIELAPAPTP